MDKRPQVIPLRRRGLIYYFAEFWMFRRRGSDQRRRGNGHLGDWESYALDFGP
jgi:hypothetical protein